FPPRVIPAKAGIQGGPLLQFDLDSRLRGNDDSSYNGYRGRQTTAYHTPNTKLATLKAGTSRCIRSGLERQTRAQPTIAETAAMEMAVAVAKIVSASAASRAVVEAATTTIPAAAEPPTPWMRPIPNAA